MRERERETEGLKSKREENLLFTYSVFIFHLKNKTRRMIFGKEKIL